MMATMQTDTAQLPVHTISEFAYCPRLFHLTHVDGRWEDNEYTLEGSEAHRRVDRSDQGLPAPADDEQPFTDNDAEPVISRSVTLGSSELGITGKLDLVETLGDTAVPVETKRGRVPNNEERSWESQRVQLMAQGLLLREHGYKCDRGVLYFATSRSRVEIPFTSALEARTLELIEQAQVAARSNQLPPPLENSPKCVGCALNAICLPDETLLLMQAAEHRREAASIETREAEEAVDTTDSVRRLFPPRVSTHPLYIQEQGAKIGKKGERLIVSKGGEELASVRLKDTSQVVLMGNVFITAQTLHLLCEAGLPVVHVSMKHWFYGITHGFGLRNALDRAAQYQAATDPEKCLEFAKAVVWGKASNQRTMLGRNIRPRPVPVLKEMAMLRRRTAEAGSMEELLGLEGAIAAKYFTHFDELLRPKDYEAGFDFSGRNRRPPTDPVNAMLSFGYAMLAKECTVALIAEGLDPWWGLYHQPRHGRPALALDLMEEFRPLIVDSAVISAVNTGMVSNKSFEISSAGCMLTASGRKDFIRAYEGRLEQLVTHPIFEYRCSWRSVIRIQARLLSRWLRGDIPRYVAIRTR